MILEIYGSCFIFEMLSPEAISTAKISFACQVCYWSPQWVHIPWPYCDSNWGIIYLTWTFLLLTGHGGIGLCLISCPSLQSLNKKYGCSVPLLLMNSFNTHEDTQKVPFSLCSCLSKFDDLLALVLTCCATCLFFFTPWRLLRSIPTPTLKFTLSIRSTPCFCYTLVLQLHLS